MDRVWSVYGEMQRLDIELSAVTYNTLIDACARCGRMDYVADIVLDMKKNKIKPNLITYSTMLKGHCQAGDIQTAFTILEQMKHETSLKPDEIMYNSLLDGCAQNNLVNEGLDILTQMQGAGVTPSNYTLSILVKLMSRSRKLDQAFQLVTDITKKYAFWPNVHVYTNLIQACVTNRQLHRGIATFEEMIKRHVQPESRTYAVLVRGHVTQGLLEPAVVLLRAAIGLPLSVSPDARLAFLSQAKSVAVCSTLDHSFVNETLVSLAQKGSVHELVVQLLSDIRSSAPKLRIDARTQRAVMSTVVADRR